MIRYRIVHGGCALPQPSNSPIELTLQIGEQVHATKMSIVAKTLDWTPTHTRVEGFVTLDGKEFFAVAVYKHDSDESSLGEIHIYES